MKNKILLLAENGYIFSKKLKEQNIPSVYITRMVKEGSIVKVAPGIYITKDVIEDMFYIYSMQYKSIVYDGQTALYLNKLTNRQFNGYQVIVPYGSKVINYKFKVRTTRNKIFYDTGISNIETPYGNIVKCYDKERCICNLFLYNDFDEEEKSYAIREYKNNYLDIKKLYEYATILGCIEEMKNVFEVIIWE